MKVQYEIQLVYETKMNYTNIQDLIEIPYVVTEYIAVCHLCSKYSRHSLTFTFPDAKPLATFMWQWIFFDGVWTKLKAQKLIPSTFFPWRWSV